MLRYLGYMWVDISDCPFNPTNINGKAVLYIVNNRALVEAD